MVKKICVKSEFNSWSKKIIIDSERGFIYSYNTYNVSTQCDRRYGSVKVDALNSSEDLYPGHNITIIISSSSSSSSGSGREVVELVSEVSDNDQLVTVS